MLVDNLLAFYSSLLLSITICYIIYRLNSDLRGGHFGNYALTAITITSIIAMLSIFLPRINMVMKVIVIGLAIYFAVVFFIKHSMYYSAVSSIFSVMILGFSEFMVSMFYTHPFKLTMEEFKTNFYYITIGRLLSFLIAYILLKLLAENFMKARKRIFKNNKKFVVLLFGNLITVLVILLFVFNLLVYYIEIRSSGIDDNIVYMSGIIVIAVLIASISGTVYLINFFLLSRLKYDRLMTSNLKDVMTGTLNRSSGLKFIEEQLELCKKQKKSMTICYIDVNDLKVINDMLGHREGDFLIKTIVGTIRENIRDTDVISRLGGDEFVIVFPGCNMDYSEKLMERISGKLRQLKPFANKDYTISISYGFSEYDGEMEITVEGLLDLADHQMYLNKRAIKAMA